MEKRKIELIRTNINIPRFLYDEVIDYSIDMGIPVSHAISVLINKGLLLDSLMKNFKKEVAKMGDKNL